MNEFNSKEVQSSNNIPPIAESLYYISARLDELTGCGMSSSQLNVYTEHSEEIAESISSLNEKIEALSYRLEDIEHNLRPLSSIAESLENIMIMYVESQKSK